MPTKSQLLTIAYTLAVIAVINNVGALEAVKDAMNYE